MNNEKKTILVDLDQTLIDTKRMKRERLAIVRSFGVPLHEARSIYHQMSREGFDPRRYMKQLISHPEHQKHAITQSTALYKHSQAYNFEGVEIFLKKLSHRYHLILLTHGHPHHQLLKLKQSGLRGFFDRTIVVQDQHKKKNIAHFYEKYGKNILLIDDSKDVARSAREVGMKIIPVRKNGKDAAYYEGILRKIEKVH